MHASRQKGITLISLMVGASISLLVAIAMLQLFKNVTQISTTAKKDAVHDSQITAALLTTGFMLQAAGFGIAQPALGADFALLSGAKIEGTQLSGTTLAVTAHPHPPDSTQSYALVWRSLSSLGAASSQCHALHAPALNSGLQLLQSQGNCPANILNAAWRPVQTLADGAHFALQAQQQACTPLGHTTGATAPSTHLLVKITAHSSAGLVLTEQYCLRNFVFDPA